MWRAVPDDCLDFRPHEKMNTIRTILVHQLLSERRFFAQFVGTEEPPVEELLPPGEKPPVLAYIDKYVWLCELRLPQFAAGTTAWWLGPATLLRRPEPASGSGFSGAASSTPATIAPRSKPGSASPGNTSPRSTGPPAT